MSGDGPPGERIGTDRAAIRCLLRKRIIVGVNECTRVLESAVSTALRDGTRGSGDQSPAALSAHPARAGFCCQPRLIVVAAEGMRPSPLALTHIPVLADQLDVPVLLLPDLSTRQELGRLLRIKSASILMFLSSSSSSLLSLPLSLKPFGSRSDLTTGTGGSDADGEATSAEVKRAGADLDSLVDFLRSKATGA
jgi:hypothetical protein